MSAGWFSVHTHSNFSVLDGMTSPESLIEKAAKDGQPYLALTDHGNMAGTIQGYLAAKSHNIGFFPGVEAYLLDPKYEGSLEDSGKADRFHIGITANSAKGYNALVKFVSTTHTRPRFNRFPRATLEDLILLGRDHGEDLMITTGCVFGWFQRTLIDEGPVQAQKVLQTLGRVFPNLYVELQNHNIDHGNGVTDADLVNDIWSMAQKLGLPVVATSDSHYTNSNHKIAHALMKKMVYGGVEDEFPGDSFHLPSGEWVAEHYTPKVWKTVQEGLADYGSKHQFEFPALDNYKPKVPVVSKTPDKTLRKLCEEALDVLYDNKMIDQYEIRSYEDRLDYELDVIKQVGMANYFLHVREYVFKLRQRKIMIEARGSGNGSLVAFLLKITQVDPIVWGTTFDRFMSVDRIKPPDLDIDIQDDGREVVLGMLASELDTVQIGTWNELGETKDAEGNVLGSSVMVSYKTYLRRRIEEQEWEKEQRIATKKGEKPKKGETMERAKSYFYARYRDLQAIDQVKSINARDWKALRTLSNMGTIYRSYGVHAAGVLIGAEDFKIEDWIPTMLVASSNTRVSMFDMHDVERLGLLKDDWLGQATLTVMRKAQELIGRKDPLDLQWIPNDDPKALEACRTGLTDTGIFHVEGYTKAKGAKELQVRTTEDLILMQALYMPGAMNSGATNLFIQRRRHKRKIKYAHPMLKEVLDSTNGVLIYQEQVLHFARLVGMDPVEIQQFFSVIKDSGKGAVARNAERMHQMEARFRELAEKKGLPDAAIQEVWRQMESMGGYAFNKAHAAGYGLRSYRTAYLKAHYPVEYMTALLQVWAGRTNRDRNGRTKEDNYVTEARRIGIRILPPDVNQSGANWTMDVKRKAILKGLVSIKGIGIGVATEIASNAPFTSIDDMCRRCNPRTLTGAKGYLEGKGMIGALKYLHDAKALQSLEDNNPPF